MAFLLYTQQFFGPVHEVGRVFIDLLSAQAAAERVDGLLETQPAIKDSSEVLAASSPRNGKP